MVMIITIITIIIERLFSKENCNIYYWVITSAITPPPKIHFPLVGKKKNTIDPSRTFQPSPLLLYLHAPPTASSSTMGQQSLCALWSQCED